MPKLRVATDKPEYAIGEIARVTCAADFADPHGGRPPDVWALVTVELQDDRGQYVSPQVYPDFPLHERDPDNEQVVSGWTAVPIQSGRWGRFRVTALFYEPERHEIGVDSVEFVVQPAAELRVEEPATASEGHWIVVAGNFADGWRAIGPFPTGEAASEWSASNAPTWEGLVAELVQLEDPDSVTWPD